MLHENNQATISDLSGKNHIKIEVNTSEKYKDKLTVKMGDKKAIIKKKDLYAIAFMIADPETQADLMPVKQTRVRKQIRQYRVKAKKDIRKGEEIVFNAEVNTPIQVIEGLNRDIMGGKYTGDGRTKTKSGIII